MTSIPNKVTEGQEEQGSFLRRHGQKLVGAAFWLALIGGYWWYTNQNDMTVRDSAEQLAVFLTTSALGPVLYVVLYVIRPLIFFPATIITVIGGFLFGPVAGIIYTVIGSNSSAMLAYVVGHYFGRGLLDSEEGESLIARYAGRMRRNSFESVLIMRLLFLPYDLVHYVAGFLRVDWKAFLLATAIGSIPGTISFVLLGTSFGTLDSLLNGELSVNPLALGASVGLILGSLLISRLVRRREQQRRKADADGVVD